MLFGGMNMIRNLLTVAVFALGVCLWFIPVEKWTWIDLLGGRAVLVLDFLNKLQPFSTILCLVIATALFMTRKQY